jgi:hypothetical protein
MLATHAIWLVDRFAQKLVDTYLARLVFALGADNQSRILCDARVALFHDDCLRRRLGRLRSRRSRRLLLLCHLAMGSTVLGIVEFFFATHHYQVISKYKSMISPQHELFI